ncbi:MAG: hypothetical protein LBR74_06655 [Eubacterium sp.]|jgi:hypothetical protein|nr:hypothetical protein [Eubacterium sp.]
MAKARADNADAEKKRNVRGEALKTSKGDKGIPEFTKGQLLKSNRYSHRRDILSVVLKDGNTYSHTAVEGLITKFMKGKVN